MKEEDNTTTLFINTSFPDQQFPEFFISGFEHHRQSNLHSTTYNLHMPRLNPILQTKRKILRKLLQFPQFPLHLPGKILQFRLEIVLNAEGEERRASQHHLHRVALRESQAHEVIQLGDERFLDARHQQDRILISQRVQIGEP